MKKSIGCKIIFFLQQLVYLALSAQYITMAQNNPGFFIFSFFVGKVVGKYLLTF